MNKRKIIVGNWKMNISLLPEAKKLVQGVKRRTAKAKKTDVVFCPPAIYFQALAPLMGGKYKLGAQNVFYKDEGAYTGEISAKQLKQFGVLYVIVGHSDRRKMGDTDDIVAKKIQAVLRNGMTPIVCIGEWARDDEGIYFQFIKDQLTASLKGLSKAQILDVIIVYEPVWCISPHRAMSGREVHEMILYVRKCLSEIFGSYGSSVQIIYGGSASPENAEDLIKEGMAEGLLPGRDSLDADIFSKIITIADRVK